MKFDVFINKINILVDPDRVNWFVFEFDIETDMFNDQKFLQLFKK